jgi:hypothetical protein
MGRIVHASDRACVQAIQNAPLALTTVLSDVTFNTTPIETDPATIEHDNVSTDNIVVKRVGLVTISYSFNLAAITVTNSTALISCRVRRNDAGGAIDGSVRLFTDFDDNSLEGNDLQSGISHSFAAEAAEGDFFTLQLAYTAVSANDPTPTANSPILFGVVAHFN